MKLLLLSMRLFIYGYFCDSCMSVCTKITEYNLTNIKPLNHKLLVMLSNLANNHLVRWQKAEKKFIRFSLEKRSF